jgi:ribosome-associated toxin RatA of RatAB toxin-antitoxin module
MRRNPLRPTGASARSLSLSRIHRSALVPRPAEQLFDLVNDIEAYPSLFDWCIGARVESIGRDLVLARLEVRIAGITTAFSTRNRLSRPESIELTLADGPLERLEALIKSELPPATDGRPANQARQCLIRRSRVRTCAGLGVGWQVLDGLVQTFLSWRWAFKPLGESGCKVTLDLDLAASGSFASQIFARGFGRIADRLVADFVRASLATA